MKTEMRFPLAERHSAKRIGPASEKSNRPNKTPERSRHPPKTVPPSRAVVAETKTRFPKVRFSQVAGEIPPILYLLLADEYLLYKITREFARNLSGSERLRLHRNFRFQLEKSAECLNAVAERILELGIGSGIGVTWMELIESAQAPFSSSEFPSAEGMISELLQSHAKLIGQLRSDIDTCLTRGDDPATAGFLAGLKEQHEHAAWILRGLLPNAEPFLERVETA